MKVKDLHFDLAKKICDKNREKYERSEIACECCPLWLNNDNFCAKNVAWFNYKYGDKEINFKEREENGTPLYKC